ncbi:hypothetical protein GF357_03345 [Candidatus Dojkabacteria bacterium]|nr:hypothetical protein [Candidatus Dojkabacteria bacterium]
MRKYRCDIITIHKSFRTIGVKIIFSIIRQKLIIYINYPLKFINTSLNEIVRIVFFIVFWKLVLSSARADSNFVQIGISQIVSYYLITGGIATLTQIFKQKLGATLRKTIKSGQISDFLIKPVPLQPSIYASVFGERIINNIVALTGIIAGFLISPPLSIYSILLFFIYFAFSLVISYSINLFEGILTFHFGNPGGIMNGIAHAGRILSGLMIPITFFPEKIRSIVEITPFAIAIFHPSTALTIESVGPTQIRIILWGIFWCALLTLTTQILWKKGLRKYEAAGL